MKQYQLDASKNELKVSIDKANGNSKYAIDLLMPEVLVLHFSEAEAPLAKLPPWRR